MNTARIDKISRIEKLMSSKLQPIDPRPEFIDHLYQRLTDPLTPSIRYPRDFSLRFVLLLIASCLSGIIFFLTLSQVILSLLRDTRIAGSIKDDTSLKLD
jgi:hypothetical protein